MSVITVSYNQGQFIEDNIKSILAQNYDNFEHIIIDACSTDETLDILKKYPHLIWTSEQDKGQSDGLNKGFKKSTGDVIFWVNSDDMLEEGAFDTVNKFFINNPDKYVITGNQLVINSDGVIDHRIPADAITYDRLLHSSRCSVMQNSTVWRREVFNKTGYLDESFHYCMDGDLFVRITKNYKIYAIDVDIAKFRIWENSKTTTGKLKFLKDKLRMTQKYNSRIFCERNFWILWQFIKHPIKKLIGKA